MSKHNSFLDIPYEEHIVPFPNFASMILQHARVYPAKMVFVSDKVSMTYSELLDMSSTLEFPSDDMFNLSFDNLCDDLLILAAALFQGKVFSINFNERSTLKLSDMKNRELDIHYFEPPYVRLDDLAIILNNTYQFTQYNVMVAAQGIGNAFKLFREGVAYCPHHITNISDLMFGILAPLYFSKTIHFKKWNDKNTYQYGWNEIIESDLRDSASVFSLPNDDKTTYKLIKSYDQALGLGKIIDPAGKTVTILGFELDESGEEPIPKGHCIGTKI